MEEQQTNSMIIENSSLDHTTPETSSNEQPSPEEIQENHENQESEEKREELREIENHLEEKKEEKREEPPEMEISTKPTEEIISERFDHPKIEDGINEQKKDRPIPIFIRDEQVYSYFCEQNWPEVGSFSWIIREYSCMNSKNSIKSSIRARKHLSLKLFVGFFYFLNAHLIWGLAQKPQYWSKNMGTKLARVVLRVSRWRICRNFKA